MLSQLQEEFPDLTISKVRFLDAQGLVSPGRTPSGYRRYSARDVERLRFVLACQRDRFWPLKVIREALDAYDRGLEPPAEAPGARPKAPAAADDPDLPSTADIDRPARALRLTAVELADAAGVERPVIADLDSFGLIHTGGDGYYDGQDLQVARAAGVLMTYGLQARHLRPFRLAADREIGLLDQLSSAPGTAARADVLRQCLALHLALVRAGARSG
ncbi:MerR family transcriptional regulator [Leekyejoonella antrihumi]|uniref:MerR family transcriptional regulator n=1 Tax=Leekyejoonella antrihumi TaxID=1660198 RepID=A0A563E325_9MICO|nr:MerR family transcriptional regulator [Leekyejoonella antrihumi]TWP36805.1 MerR family transcriptional regulator [Leekyejoonella antrihumi]